MSVRELERAIQQTRKLGAVTRKASAPKRTDPNLKAAEDRLRRHFGTQIRILAGGKQGGKIELDYYDDKDLDRLYNLLLGKADTAGTATA
jgi:ParB family chromosome partitioning protein